MAGTTWGDYAEEASKAGGSFGPHPVGTFNMRVESAEVKSAKNEKKAILARLVTIDGPAQGTSLLNNMTPFKNNGEANGFFMQELAALGFGKETNPEFWSALDAMTHEQGVSYISQAIVGASATVVVNHRKYQDTMKDNVKRMMPLGTEPATQVLEPEIVQPTLPGAVPAVPGVANPIAAAPAVAPVAAAPVAAAPAPAPAPVATAPPVAAAPAPVAAPVVAAPPAAVPVAEPAEASTAVVVETVVDVPAAPVATTVVAPVAPVERPEGAPF